MSDEEGVNHPRRRFLSAATTVMGAGGLIGVATPFVASWNPNARARAAGAPVEVDLRKLQPDSLMTLAWRGAPVFVVRRSEETLRVLDKNDQVLADPASARSQQPKDARNNYRSRRPEYLVVRGVCTHLGCAPQFLDAKHSPDGGHWTGGFFCPCHGSKFDMAGRVYRSVPAPTNLEVPDHHFPSDTTLVVGDRGEKA